ncbi:hypothetical protein [Kribbella sp. NPDC003557]|uniref:hypothetical protein n=1 Tax=Kribbella sp. NPDC003557 TaxID=3154449 RepID=UPI0033AFEAA5
MDDRFDGLELLGNPGALEDADAAEVLGTLTTLHRLREYLDQWEPVLVDAARARGVTWAEIAPTLGLASRQAAERRYLRLKPHTADQPGTTRERRVQAARDRRSGDRAVAGWARDNAGALRQLAGQVTALPSDSSNPSAADAAPAIDRLRDALGGDDVAELIQPLAAAGRKLRESHPDLADEISTVTRTADTVRTTDLARRTPADD